MGAEIIRMTHKIAIQLHLVAESCTICSSRSGNVWIHPRISYADCVYDESSLEKVLSFRLELYKVAFTHVD
jgi:hypothetical protein